MNNVPSLNAYQPNQMVQPTTTELRWVQGKLAAQAYALMPGVNGIFFDTEASKFYMKSTNYVGVPTPLREFEYTEILPQPENMPEPVNYDDKYVSKDDFNALAEKINALTEKLERKNNYKKGGYRNEQ